MRYLLAAVLYTALAATANADMSDLEALRAGDMRKLQIHSASRPAPDTVFLHADGSELRLSDYRGKVVVLNFWATWCAPCRKEIPILIQAQKEYGDQGLQIIGLAVDEPEPVRKYAQQFGINYPVLVDAINVVKLQDKLEGGAGLPVSILIDREGKVRERVIGEIDQAQLNELLAPYFSQ